MKKRKILTRDMDVRDMKSFSEFYDELSSDLDLKIERFNRRRRREVFGEY